MIERAANFSGEAVDEVDVFDLFGMDPSGIDPRSAEGEQLQDSYIERNWASADGPISPPKSSYNDGKKAILHMANGVNSINAAIKLAVHAAYPLGTGSGAAARPLTGGEAVETGTQAAAPCRNIDPNIVSKVIQAKAGLLQVDQVLPPVRFADWQWSDYCEMCGLSQLIGGRPRRPRAGRRTSYSAARRCSLDVRIVTGSPCFWKGER